MFVVFNLLCYAVYLKDYIKIDNFDLINEWLRLSCVSKSNKFDNRTNWYIPYMDLYATLISLIKRFCGGNISFVQHIPTVKA